MNLTRRSFISATAAATLLMTRKAAASERVRHAVIGTGGQGQQHVHLLSSLEDCEVVAVCDVDPERCAKAAQSAGGAKESKDYREVLDNPSIDSVSVVTADHWHTPIALAALMAGKHVYVEKPCGHNVREGRILAKAAAHFGKCVQHGTQHRSGEGPRAAVEYLQSGKLGKVRMAKAINHQLREPIGRAPVSSPPAGVNYDLWLGPAPAHPFTQNRWHYNWHWFWDYGCGDIGNDGIHQIDMARWGLGVGYPKAITAAGGQLFYDDDHETPDTQTVVYEYDDCYLQYEMRLWTNYPLEGHDNGVVFYGDKGTLEVGREGVHVTLIGDERRKLGGSHDINENMANFIACVKTNDADALNAPISEGAISNALCHLGNISTRVGRRLNYDAGADVCTGDDEATKLLAREYRSGYELPWRT